jgi:ribonuclease P/MRP protein subunit RPP40
VLVVDIDLNAPAMWPGKKGFDRLMYACKNALNQRLTWLFYNLSTKSMYMLHPIVSSI